MFDIFFGWVFCVGGKHGPECTINEFFRRRNLIKNTSWIEYVVQKKIFTIFLIRGKNEAYL